MNYRVLFFVAMVAIMVSCKPDSKPAGYDVQTGDSVAEVQPVQTQQTPSVSVMQMPEEVQSQDEEEVIEQPTYQPSPVTIEEEDPFAQYSNFEPSSNDVPGVVVYEGADDYFIGENRRGYFIFERYSGWPSEGDQIYGATNGYGFRYVINPRKEREYRIYIEDYALTWDDAAEWMRDNDHIR